MEAFSFLCDMSLYEVGSTENLRLQDFPQVPLQDPKHCRGGHSSSSQANHLKVILSWQGPYFLSIPHSQVWTSSVANMEHHRALSQRDTTEQM